VRSGRPDLGELRAVAQPPDVIGRVSGEHWAGKLYMRHVSIRFTRALAPTRATPDGLTWGMLVAGLAAAAVLTVPHWWAALVTVLLVQLQLLLDCSDGELARWRRRTGPSGIYIDRLGHYVTDAGLAIAVGVRAGGGLGSINGWTSVGLAAGVLVLLVKAETDLVHVARAGAGLPQVTDDAGTAAPRQSLVRRLRRMVLRVPFYRALLALELSLLALLAAVIDAAAATDQATKLLAVSLPVIGVIVVAGHLLGVLSSGRLR